MAYHPYEIPPPAAEAGMIIIRGANAWAAERLWSLSYSTAAAHASDWFPRSMGREAKSLAEMLKLCKAANADVQPSHAGGADYDDAIEVVRRCLRSGRLLVIDKTRRHKMAKAKEMDERIRTLAHTEVDRWRETIREYLRVVLELTTSEADALAIDIADMSTEDAKLARATTGDIEKANEGGGLNFLVGGFPSRIFTTPPRPFHQMPINSVMQKDFGDNFYHRLPKGIGAPVRGSVAHVSFNPETVQVEQKDDKSGTKTVVVKRGGKVVMNLTNQKLRIHFDLYAVNQFFMLEGVLHGIFDLGVGKALAKRHRYVK